MLGCTYAGDVVWGIWTCIAVYTKHEISLGLLALYGIAFMITWYSLRTYDRYAFTAFLHAHWGVWASTSFLGLLSRILDGIFHICIPVWMFIWNIQYIQWWMSIIGVISVLVMQLGRKYLPLRYQCYLYYQFQPNRSKDFWDAAYRVECILHCCIPLFSWFVHEHSFMLRTCTIGVGGLAMSMQLLRSYLLPKIRDAATDIMNHLLLQGNLHAASAIRLTDSTPHTDIVVHDGNFWLDWMSEGLVAIGESYVSGQWSMNPHSNLTLDGIIFRLLTLPVEARREMYQSWNARFVSLSTRIFYFPSSAATHIVGPVSVQFNMTPAFHQSYLGPQMLKIFGLWMEPEDTIETAQERSLEELGRRLGLTPGQLVLDLHIESNGSIGCYLARHYRVQVISIVSSRHMQTIAEAAAQHYNVHSHVHFISLDGQRLENVLKTLPNGFHAITASRLETLNLPMVLSILTEKVHGRLVLDFIATPTRANTHVWSNKYIDINQPIQSVSYSTVRGTLIENGWSVIETQSYAEHCDKTYMAWYQKFEYHSDILPDSFRRTWEFYLLHNAACFRARNLQLYRITLQSR